MHAPLEVDYALVGGGLQNALIALSLFRQQPAARVALVERELGLGGNHTWCFHAGDIPAALADVVAPLVVKSWSGYDVFFPALERRVDASYSAVSSARLDAVLREAFTARPGSRLICGAAVVRASDREVVLADGRVLRAGIVIESKGPTAELLPGKVGFQKFIGLELDLEAPCSIEHPVLMDARVPQLDGFRFMYVLPLSPTRVLLEDTYFSDSKALDERALCTRILAYAAASGLSTRSVVRSERGVLPLPLHSAPAPEQSADRPFLGGYAGGWFHPTTGYSFPAAARVAQLVSGVSRDALAEAWLSLGKEHRRQFGFLTFLNRLMFGAFAPEERYGAIERFYRLPEATLRRFYAMTLTATDRARIFCDRPPRGFSLRRVLRGGAA
jgi:lycopene beta-cyclase